MRTTLTLDPDVVELLKAEVQRQRKSFKEVVNDAVRRGLVAHGRPSSRGRYRVRPHKTALRPGIDAVSLNQLVDELEDEAVMAKGRR